MSEEHYGNESTAASGYGEEQHLREGPVDDGDQPAANDLHDLFSHADTREIFYAALTLSREGLSRAELETALANHPALASTVLSPASCIDILIGKSALEQTVRQADGSEISTEDFVAQIESGATTKANGTLVVRSSNQAMDAVGEMSVSNRLTAMFGDIDPEMAGLYREALSFCASPRTLKQIESLISSLGYSTSPTRDRETVYASTVMNTLAQTGAVCWDGGWVLTREGVDALN